MDVINDISLYAAGPSAVCVGVFDGLHLGHQDLLAQLVAQAKSRNLTSVVVTFEPHPRIVLSKGNDRVGLLTTAQERNDLLAKIGIDILVVVPFTREFSDLTAREFLNSYLAVRLQAKFLLMGYNHRFGSDDVTPDGYPALAQEAGIQTLRAGAFSLPGNVKVSSTEVRNALSRGDVATAAALLGRPYSLSGNVVHGDAIGRKLGFPTANIVPADERKLIPADGVYACQISFDGEKPRPAVLNVGTRPTVGGADRRIEAHVLDFDGDVYGDSATILFISRIRDEKKFRSQDDLAKQIMADVAAARNASHD